MRYANGGSGAALRLLEKVGAATTGTKLSSWVGNLEQMTRRFKGGANPGDELFPLNHQRAHETRMNTRFRSFHPG